MINIRHTDALENLKSLQDNCVDLTVMDPPYEFKSDVGGGAFGSKTKAYHKELENAHITKGFDKEILDEIVRVMKVINIYVWCNKNQIRDYLNYFKDCNIDILTWHKTNPVPACCNKYLSDTEYLLFIRGKGAKLYGSYATKKKYFISPCNAKDKKLWGHPTIKPFGIIKTLISNSSREGDLVLDPFLGSGTTAVACKQLNRDFVGSEINEEYFETALKRLKLNVDVSEDEVISRETLIDTFSVSNESILLEPHEVYGQGIIGTVDKDNHTVACYSYEHLLDALVSDNLKEEMSLEEAQEAAVDQLEYNTLRTLDCLEYDIRPVIMHEIQL